MPKQPAPALLAHPPHHKVLTMTLHQSIAAPALSYLPESCSLRALEALQTKPAQRLWSPMAQSAYPLRAIHLTGKLPTLDARCNTADVLAFFANHTAQESVAVLDGDVPLGLISKGRFITRYAREHAVQSVHRLPCTHWIPVDALVIDGDASADELLAQASQMGRHAFVDGFVATVNGRYAGLGKGTALRNLRLDIEAEVERQRLAFMDFAYPMLQHLQFVTYDHLSRSLLDHHALVQSSDAFGGDSVFARLLGNGMLLGVMRGERSGYSCSHTGLSAQLWLDAAVESIDRTGRDPDVGDLLGRLHRLLQGDFAQSLAGADLSDTAQAPMRHGLQIALVWLPHHGKSLQFAGAHAAMRVVRPGGLEVRQRTGSHVRLGQIDAPSDVTWPVQEVPLGARHRVMLVTDGVTGLAGGPFNEPLNGAQLTRFVRNHSSLDVRDSGPLFEHMLATWQGPREPRADLASLMFTSGPKG